MQKPLKYLMLSIAFTLFMDVLPAHAFPRKEFPFCPGGGPPGWMNYFDYKRDQNRWRRQHYHPANFRPAYFRPVYWQPASSATGYYSPRPDFSSNVFHQGAPFSGHQSNR